MALGPHKGNRTVFGGSNVETNPQNYHGSVSGFLTEIDRMQLDVKEYLSVHPAELAKTDA